jgi:hypothetical protein
MRQGAWSPAYRRIDSYEINHYLVEHFGRIPLGQLGTFEIQVWLNKLATMCSQSLVRHCYVNIRSITRGECAAGSELSTSEILSNWKPTHVSAVQLINGESAAPKRRTVNLARGLDQNGPSEILKESLSA